MNDYGYELDKIIKEYIIDRKIIVEYIKYNDTAKYWSDYWIPTRKDPKEAKREERQKKLERIFK